MRCDRKAGQTIAFPLEHVVTLAAHLLKFVSIQNGDAPTLIADRAEISKGSRGCGDTLAAHTEAIGEHFVSHEQFIT